MSQILVRDLSPETVAQLKQRAKHNHRSLEAEVRQILEDAAERDLAAVEREAARAEFWRFADEMRQRSGPQTTDSVDLIREDRER